MGYNLTKLVMSNKVENQIMEKKLEQRKTELLKELKKNVPQIEWEFGEVREEKRFLNDGRILNDIKIYINGVHKESNDDCFIIDDRTEGEISSIVCGYYHNGKTSFYSGKNKNWIYEDNGRTIGIPFKSVWDKTNEFFNDFCIGKEERERKIMSGEMISPNMRELENYGKNKMSENEYSQGLINLFLPYEYDKNKNYIIQSFKKFENQYRELMKKIKSEEEYEKLYKDRNQYFGTPSEMILSFLDNRLNGMLEYYLEDLWNEVESEELETIKE